MANLNDYLTEELKGKCFKEKNSAQNFIQATEFVPAKGDGSSEAGVRVWYPLSNTYGFISSTVFENYIPCSATEIERIRRFDKPAQSPASCTRDSEPRLPLVVSTQTPKCNCGTCTARKKSYTPRK